MIGEKKIEQSVAIITKGVLISVVALLTACAGSNVTSDGSGSVSAPKAKQDPSFYQRWVHSYEEQGGNKTPNIFRPAGSRSFPPSRFRMEFGFDPSGQCNYKYLSPVDAHEMRDCVYTKVDNKVYLYSNTGASLSHLAFTIESLNQGEMRIAYGVKPSEAKDTTKKNAKPQ